MFGEKNNSSTRWNNTTGQCHCEATAPSFPLFPWISPSFVWQSAAQHGCVFCLSAPWQGYQNSGCLHLLHQQHPFLVSPSSVVCTMSRCRYSHFFFFLPQINIDAWFCNVLRDRKKPFSNRGKLAPQAFLCCLTVYCSCSKTLCLILELRISKSLAIDAVFKTQEFETENISAFSLMMQITLQY